MLQGGPYRTVVTSAGSKSEGFGVDLGAVTVSPSPWAGHLAALSLS